MFFEKWNKENQKLNEFYPKRVGPKGAYLLVAAAKEEIGSCAIVSFLVNEYTGKVEEFDTLYSMNANKKESAGFDPRGFKANAKASTDSKIKITDLFLQSNTCWKII